jgi:CheY-like chemotaxis protein
MASRPKKSTILIIEDDADIRTFAARVLELEGYAVFQAKSGEEGLGRIREDNISLVLLDLRLPGESGWTVLGKMKAESGTANIPVVVFTASVGVSQYNRAKAMGATAYLTKPLSATALKDEVNRTLKQKKPKDD